MNGAFKGRGQDHILSQWWVFMALNRQPEVSSELLDSTKPTARALIKHCSDGKTCLPALAVGFWAQRSHFPALLWTLGLLQQADRFGELPPRLSSKQT